MTSKNLDLCRGETVIIENYGEDVSYINIYFPIDNNENLFVNNANIKKIDNFFVLSGYIDSKYLTRICEPLNENNYYIIRLTNNSESGSPILEYSIYNKFTGYISIELNDKVKNVELKDVYSLESLLLYYISENSIWYSYLSTYAPVRMEGQGLVSRCDIDAHLPEYEWTEKEYNAYYNVNKLYSKYVIDMLNDYNVTEDLLVHKNYFIKKTQNCMKIESIWVDWAYIGKLKNKFFYDEVLKRIKFSEIEQKEISDIFKNEDIKVNGNLGNTFINENSSITDQIFGYKISMFYNNYIINDEVMKDFQRIIEYIVSKYI